MKALVAGGAGFIGSHLVDRLLAADDKNADLTDNTEAMRATQVLPMRTISVLGGNAWAMSWSPRLLN